MSSVIRRLRALAVVPLVLLASACGPDAPERAGTWWTPPSAAAVPPAPVGDPAALAKKAIAAMSDADLAGQVLMPYAYGNSATSVDAASAAGNQKLAGVDTPAAMVAKYHLGGLILVSFSAEDPTGATNPTTNVEDPKQVRALTDGLQIAARALPGGAPLMIGTDQEYGVVTRVTTGVTLLPSAMAAGAAGNRSSPRPPGTRPARSWRRWA